MATGVRSSPRHAGKNQNPTSPQSTGKAGTKRKATKTPTKKERPAKEQKTIEETLDPAEQTSKGIEGEIVKEAEASPEANADSNANGHEQGSNEANGRSKGQPDEEMGNASDKVMADENDTRKTNKVEASQEVADGAVDGAAIEEDKQREKAQPSNILEKGIVYFFMRGRVDVDDPDSVQDLQRSFFVLRPLPPGAKITDGAIQDVGNNRLIALPKKVWPKSGKDRFMAFVEQSAATMDKLKETFFSGSEYSTKTTGTRHTPEVTPIGEGVYAMTSTGEGRTTTHLAYMLTIPQELGEVQKDVGLAGKGSFVLSTKNPESSSPAYAQLPSTAEYPRELIEEFGSRGWLPTKPEHLNYDNASILLIGEDFDSSGALAATAKDEKDEEKEVPKEELEKLEGEDEERIEHLKGDDSIFEDLGISSKEYPKVKSTW